MLYHGTKLSKSSERRNPPVRRSDIVQLRVRPSLSPAIRSRPNLSHPVPDSRHTLSSRPSPPCADSRDANRHRAPGGSRRRANVPNQDGKQKGPAAIARGLPRTRSRRTQPMRTTFNDIPEGLRGVTLMPKARSLACGLGCEDLTA
jgi:hypothetical protein